LKLTGLVLVLCASTVHGECEEGKWEECRQDLVQAIFNQTTIPSRHPDYILPGGGPQVERSGDAYTMNGLPGPGNGTGIGDVQWENNLTALVWTMTGPFLTLNTTVLYSLNTSSRAAANYNPPPYSSSETGPGIPMPDGRWGEAVGYAPQSIGDTLIMYHNGHESNSCTPNYDGVVDHFNQLGYDVMELMMPLIGCNQAYQYGNPLKHGWFQQYEDKGDYTMRYFIEPVALAASYAKSLGYKHIVMVGLSGGGWTTTVASAVVTDIELSFPTAGSTPKCPTKTYPKWVPDLPEGHNKKAVWPGDIMVPPPIIGAGGDYEQEQARPMFKAVGGYLQMYVLAALEEGRHQVQILHEYDSCCFRAASLHDEIKDYNAYVQTQVNGWMQTAVTAGNFHEVNYRDKVVIASIVERLRKKGKLTKADFVNMPFDDLMVQG